MRANERLARSDFPDFNDPNKLGQGKENSRRFLIDNPELAEEIEGKILAKLGSGAAAPAPGPAVPEGL